MNNNTCYCNNGWDIRCCCMPPMPMKSVIAPSDSYDDNLISWYKKEGYEDNWDKCGMRVVTAHQLYKDSRICKYTKKDEIHIPYARWFLDMGMGLNKKEINEVVDIIKVERREERREAKKLKIHWRKMEMEDIIKEITDTMEERGLKWGEIMKEKVKYLERMVEKLQKEYDAYDADDESSD